MTKLIKKYPKFQQGGKSSAVYLHYPNFKGQAANALVIGGVDIGKKIFGSKPVLPVGHDELITFDTSGRAKLIRYGRYKTGIGHVRPTVKGGNWNIISLPRRKQNEPIEKYITRIKGSLEDAKYGPFEATEVSNVDVDKIINYAKTQANDKDRPEYSIYNTCATGATNALKAGLSLFDQALFEIPRLKFSRADESIGASIWGYLPGTTQSYNRHVSNVGKSYIIK